MYSVTSASRYHPRYQSISSMYICGLIARNFTELAEADPIGSLLWVVYASQITHASVYSDEGIVSMFIIFACMRALFDLLIFCLFLKLLYCRFILVYSFDNSSSNPVYKFNHLVKSFPFLNNHTVLNVSAKREAQLFEYFK